MTKTTFDSSYQRLAMNCPFGYGDPNRAEIKKNSAAGHFNFEDGFDTTYSAPKSNNGNFVTRGEMNAIGNLASRNDFYHQCGGINTFNPSLADAIGGYPQGAVLDFIHGNQINKVISLIDDNKIDFTASGSGISGIIEGSVDGINWMFLNQEEGSIADLAFSGDIYSSIYQIVGIFKATKNSSTFRFESDLKISYSNSVSFKASLASGGMSQNFRNGMSIYIKDLGTSFTPGTNISNPEHTISTSGIVSNWNGWTNLYGNLTIEAYYLLSGQSVVTRYGSSNINAFTGFTNNHFYAIGIFGSGEKYEFLGQENDTASSKLISMTKEDINASGKIKLFYS